MTSDAWQTVLLASIALVATLGAPVIAFLLARVTAMQAEALRATKDIHTVVNSQQTELKDQIKVLQESLLVLRDERATLVEAARGLAAGVVSDTRSAASRAEGVTEGKAMPQSPPTQVEIVSSTTTVPVTVVEPPPEEPKP